MSKIGYYQIVFTFTLQNNKNPPTTSSISINDTDPAIWTLGTEKNNDGMLIEPYGGDPIPPLQSFSLDTKQLLIKTLNKTLANFQVVLEIATPNNQVNGVAIINPAYTAVSYQVVGNSNTNSIDNGPFVISLKP